MMGKKKKPEPKLEYLQDPKTIKDPELLKPLYRMEQKAHDALTPDNIQREIKKGVKAVKKAFKEAE